MPRMNESCKNCGGDYALHHYETNQCPVGGREAAIGRKQEWKSTTFESIEPDLAYQAARDTIAAQAARIQELETKLAAAVLYISVNVCDPDTTAEMWEAWKVYQEAMKVQS